MNINRLLRRLYHQCNCNGLRVTQNNSSLHDARYHW